MPRSTKTKLAIPALIVFLAAAAGGYQVWAQHQARAELDAAFADLPAGSQGHYKTMSFNAFTRTMRIDGLVITHDGHPTLTIQAVTLHHLSGSGTLADPFQASAVHLSGTELWRGSHSLTAAHVDGEDISVLAPGVPAPAGTPNWLVSPGNATLISAGAITATTIADDEGASLAALSIAEYADGQLGQGSASGFADAHGNRIASAAVHAVDLGGLDAVFDTGRYNPGAPSDGVSHPLIGHAEISGVQSQAKGVSVAVASITLDGFAARPFDRAPNTAYVNTPDFLRDAASALSIGTASFSGLHYQDDQTALSATLAAVSLSGYADGALAQASVNGLAISGSGSIRVTVGHFALTGLNATRLLNDTSWTSNQSLIEAAGNGAVHLAGLMLARVSVTPATGHTMTLDSITETTTGSDPTRFAAQLRGLSIPAQSTPELAQGLGAIGVDPLVLDLDETGSEDTANRTAALDPLVLTARGLGSLSLSAQFTNLPQGQPPTGSALAALSTVGIGPFTIRFANVSLVQRIIAMQARQAGKTPEEIMDEAKLAGSFAAAALVPGQPDAGQQVAAFIADPQALTITATPATPIPVGAFLGAGREIAQSALNLRLSAN